MNYQKKLSDLIDRFVEDVSALASDMVKDSIVGSFPPATKKETYRRPLAGQTPREAFQEAIDKAKEKLKKRPSRKKVLEEPAPRINRREHLKQLLDAGKGWWIRDKSIYRCRGPGEGRDTYIMDPVHPVHGHFLEKSAVTSKLDTIVNRWKFKGEVP